VSICCHVEVRRRHYVIMTRSALVVVLLVAGCRDTPPAVPRPAEVGVARAAPAIARPAPAAAERAALRTRGIAAYERGDFAACTTLLEQAGDSYDAACCHARIGHADQAFGLLDRAFAEGFRDVDHLQVDADLASLHDDARWTPMVGALTRRVAAYRATINPELADIYAADQADRAGPHESIDWTVVSPRDLARRRRVDELIASGGAKVSDDYLHAAMVYQHGETLDDIQRANALARKAVELDPRNDTARWLVAASDDRALVRQHALQKWGTQYTKRDGTWVLEPYDRTTTDAERAEAGVPPLAEALARADAMNTAAGP